MTKPHADCWAWVVERYRELAGLPGNEGALAFLPLVIEVAESEFAPRLHPWLDQQDLLLGRVPWPEGRYRNHLRLTPLSSGGMMVVLCPPEPQPTDPTDCGPLLPPPIDFCFSPEGFWPVLTRFVSLLEARDEELA
jgi:hypothetical protein